MHHNVTMRNRQHLAVALFIFKGCKLREKALVSFTQPCCVRSFQFQLMYGHFVLPLELEILVCDLFVVCDNRVRKA